MRNQGWQVRPVHLRPWFDVAFNVVSVEFNEAREDKVLRAVDGAVRDAVPFRDVRDNTVFNGERPDKDPIRQNQLRICQTEVI